MMTPKDILQSFHAARVAPLAAMRDALANKEDVLPAFLVEFERAAQLPWPDLPYLDAYGIMFEILGEWADTRSYRPIVNFLRRDEETLEQVLGECLTEIGDRVLAGIATDDLAPLRDLILDAKAYAFARSQAILALTHLWIARPGQRIEVEALVRDIGTRLERGADDIVVTEWAAAVAILGIADQVAQARAAVNAIPRKTSPLWPEEFEERLNGRPEDLSDPWYDRYGVVGKRIDAIADVSRWHWVSDDGATAIDSALRNNTGLLAWPDVAFNPHRHVGRNDPCPCGSGKKYKKCCLAGG